MIKKEILVIGSNGQIGHSLCQSDWGPTINVVGVDRKQLDLNHHTDVERLLSEKKWDYVINATAYRDVEKAELERDVCYQTNVVAVENLSKICDQYMIPLFHYSTDYVFDGTKSTPYSEDDDVHPINHYGSTKEEGERMIREALSQHVILRVAWVYGDHGQNFLKRTWLQCGQQDTVWFTNDQYGCPTSAHDIACVTRQMIQKNLADPQKDIWGTYHYSGSPVTTWYEVAQKIVDFYNEHNPSRTIKVFPMSSEEAQKKFNLMAKRPPYTYLSCEKITRVFGIEPKSWPERLLSVLLKIKKAHV